MHIIWKISQKTPKSWVVTNFFGQNKCFLVHHSSHDSLTHCSFLPGLRCSGCSLEPITEGSAHTCRCCVLAGSGASGFVVWATPSLLPDNAPWRGVPLCLHHLSPFKITLRDSGFLLPLLWGPSLALLEKPGFPKSLPCWAGDGNITLPVPVSHS